MIVLDASVAAKWLFAEPGRDDALALLESTTQLFAPSVVQLEVTGAILRRFRERAMKEEQARLAYALWTEILNSGRIHLLNWEELIQAASELAFETRHTLYDCLYVAAAQQLEIDLLTADVALKKRVGPRYSRIVLLGASLPISVSGGQQH